ncbi:MAG: hypothetical protein AABW89_04965 [Nanoarchaeota archaeon]
MMREDIVGMLKNAIEHGGNPSRVAQSLINSGYALDDVREALNYVLSLNPQAIAQNTTQQEMPKPPTYNSQSIQPSKPSPLKPLPSQKSNPTSKGKITVMVIILILLLLSLISVIVFKDGLLDLLKL